MKQLGLIVATALLVTGCSDTGKSATARSTSVPTKETTAPVRKTDNPTSSTVTTTTATAPVVLPVTFPTIPAKTLAGRSVTFPDETRGRIGLIFVAFEQRAQQDITTWVKPLIERYLDAPDIGYYEIPMISSEYRSSAGQIDGGMRSGVPKDLHDRTATFYGDREGFFTSLGIGDQSVAYLFVLNQKGEVVFHTQGRANATDIAAVDAAIAAARTS
jgi:hypothetical protein